MSTFTRTFIIPFDFDIEDTFSSTYSPDYISASLDYFLASPRNTFSDPLEDLSKYLLALIEMSPFLIILLYFCSLPQVFKIGESSYKISLERQEEHIETILNHLDELPLKLIELETELQEARTQITGLQKEKMRHNDEIVLARIRISTLEMIIKDIQVHYRSDMKSLLDKIRELKNHKGGQSYYYTRSLSFTVFVRI
nr:hypothetical protein [Tanacetum cinerariifolium]